MMPIEPDLLIFSRLGLGLKGIILTLSAGAGGLGLVNLCQRRPFALAAMRGLALVVAGLLVAGFLLIGWLNLRIYQRLPLKVPADLLYWLNQGLAAMNAREGTGYGLPLIDPAQPPRYILPLWIENGKYYFWFMAYALMILPAIYRPVSHRLRGALVALLALQNAILFLLTDPFSRPLPKFFDEIGPWFSGTLDPLGRLGQFMRLYPRMLFYYNTPYMWLHPPLLFMSYAAITVTFVASLFMLAGRGRPEVEVLGYDYAKFGYFMLTLGMLLGYPWALEAWGPNWWWDPKICSSIMMWAIYSTYLHTRLYAHRKTMWYFTSGLGIVCFAAMIFTFITSFYFPGEHTGQ